MKFTPWMGALALGTIIAAGGAPASAAALVGPPPSGGAQSAAEHALGTGSPTEAQLDLVQHRRHHHGPRHYHGPRFYGGGPGWGYRPWYRRPYYGTIIAGVALGTIIGVTAYGLAPRPPRPDLCWYWADEPRSRGYWDYC